MTLADTRATHAGEVRFDGKRISGLDAPGIVRAGLALSPEGRRVWPGLSVAPHLENGKLGFGRVAVRTFLCRRGDDYQVMPGGMARTNAPPDGLFLSGRAAVAGFLLA